MIKMASRNIPSLVDLCIQSAIDNVQFLGDVGQTDVSLLRKILPHCTTEQLLRIETSSIGRDLSSITDELWRKCYARKFGPENVEAVMKRMKKRGVSFKWKLLYEAKMREQEEVQKQYVDRLKQLYAEAEIKKQSRQIQICTKVPPIRKRKRCDMGGSGSSNCFSDVKGRLMKKAKMEFSLSEARMQSAVRNKPAASNIKATSVPYKTVISTSGKKPASLPPRKDAIGSVASKGNCPASRFLKPMGSGLWNAH
eukprot:c25316_g1_i1 orf=385-1143(+)